MLEPVHNGLAELLSLDIELNVVLVEGDVLRDRDGVAVGEEATERLEERVRTRRERVGDEGLGRTGRVALGRAGLLRTRARR